MVMVMDCLFYACSICLEFFPREQSILQEDVKLGKLALIPALKLFNAPLSSADATCTSPQLLSHEPAFLVKFRKHIFIALHLVYEVVYIYMTNSIPHYLIFSFRNWSSIPLKLALFLS